jgi:deoxyribodipyrimidine photo-lyase
MKTAIWWLRRDLRLLDNQALQAALAFAPKVLPVFLLDPALLHSGYVGEKRLSFLFGCLAELDRDLRSKGSYLVLRKGSPAETLPALIQETGAERVFAERDVSPYATQRDRKIEQQVPVEWVGFPTVHPPWAVHKADGSPYTVFTPFSKAWKALPLPTQAAHDPLQRIDSPMGVQSESLPELPPLESPLPFPPGEAEALLRLERFCAGGRTRRFTTTACSATEWMLRGHRDCRPTCVLGWYRRGAPRRWLMLPCGLRPTRLLTRAPKPG